PLVSWLAQNSLIVEIAVGVLVPLTTLLLFELRSKQISAGFTRMQTETISMEATSAPRQLAVYPARLLAYSMGVLSLIIYALAFTAGDQMGLVIAFGLVLSAICGVILWSLRKN